MKLIARNKNQEGARVGKVAISRWRGVQCSDARHPLHHPTYWVHPGTPPERYTLYTTFGSESNPCPMLAPFFFFFFFVAWVSWLLQLQGKYLDITDPSPGSSQDLDSWLPPIILIYVIPPLTSRHGHADIRPRCLSPDEWSKAIHISSSPSCLRLRCGRGSVSSTSDRTFFVFFVCLFFFFPQHPNVHTHKPR